LVFSFDLYKKHEGLLIKLRVHPLYPAFYEIQVVYTQTRKSELFFSIFRGGGALFFGRAVDGRL